MVRRLPSGLAVVSCVAALWAGAPAVRAETADVNATTLLSLRQEPRDGRLVTVAPAFLFFNMSGHDIQNPVFGEMDMVLSSWGRVDPGTPRDHRLLTGDVNLAYVQSRFLNNRLNLRGGRHIIWQGAARGTALDGVSGSGVLWGGFGASAYAGMPVQDLFQVLPYHYDFVAGARAFYRYSVNGEVGVSFSHLMGNGRLRRQDVALDGRWALHRTFTVNGFLLWSTANTYANLRTQLPGQRSVSEDVANVVEGNQDVRTDRPPWVNGVGGTLSKMWPMIAEADLSGTWQPVNPVAITAGYRRTSPDLFLSQSSIFSVFTRMRRDEVGGQVYFKPARRLTLSGDYYLVDNTGQSGHRGGLRASTYFSAIRPINLSAEIRMLTLPSNGYAQGRVYSVAWLAPTLTGTLDTDVYVFQKPINGQRISYTSAATLGWAFLPGWQLMASGAAAVTPWVEYRFETMFKIAYNFSAHLREGSNP